MAASIYLRWKDGVYAIDADKSLDKDETILSVMVIRRNTHDIRLIDVLG
jgi:hypothetical protein